MLTHVLFLLLLFVTTSVQATEPTLIDSQKLTTIDDVVADALAEKRMPGCVVLVGFRGQTVFLKSYGHRQILPEPMPMQTDTLFDLASLTKPIATATAIMHLIEQGKLQLHDPVSNYLPEFAQNGKDAITVFHLLTHQSGLIADNALKDYQSGIENAFAKIDELTLKAPPGEAFIYSDVGFIVLGRLVEKVSGLTLHEYTQQHLFTPLQMTSTGYLPAADLRSTAALTQQRDGEWMQGDVHDPRAFLLGKVAGHAGLFSTAEDLARYAQMFLNDGEFDGVRILKPDTAQLMRGPVKVSSGLRTLGWDMKTGYSSNRSDLYSASAFGHGGFTGTGLWIDPEQELFVIFLSNRVHPNGKGAVNTLIGKIGTLAVEACLTDKTDN